MCVKQILFLGFIFVLESFAFLAPIDLRAILCTQHFTITTEGVFNSEKLNVNCPRIFVEASPELSLKLECFLKRLSFKADGVFDSCYPYDDLTIETTYQKRTTFDTYCVTNRRIDDNSFHILITDNLKINSSIRLSMGSRDISKTPLHICNITARYNHSNSSNIESALQVADKIKKVKGLDELFGQCGQIKDIKTVERILGGKEAKPHNYPWMVFIIVDVIRLCGGSIISEKFILTAAHCTLGARKIRIYLGVHDLEEKDVYRDSVQVIIHPLFKFPNFDISLVKVSSPIVYSQNIRPVCLPTIAANPGDVLIALGWGKTSDDSGASSVLKENNLTLISDAICSLHYKFKFDKTVMCTLDPPGEAVCQGDSGSVVGRMENGSFVQHGIVSFTPTICSSGQPGGHIEVLPFVPWIREVMKNSDRPKPKSLQNPPTL